MVVDYSKAKIYKIINDVNDEIYVGSTVLTLSQRMAHHKEKSVRYPDRKLYKFISNNGGWCHFKIILIEDYPCERRDQMVQREQYYKDFLKATLNDFNCYGLDKNRRHDTVIRYRKQYNEINKEALKEYMEKYYESNKENIKQSRNQYYNSNIDKIKEYRGKVHICVCGKEYTNNHKKRHEQTKRHQDFINQQQKIM